MRILRCMMTLLLLMTACPEETFAQSVRVWESPAIGYYNLAPRLRVNRVELSEKQTAVSFHMSNPPGVKIGFTKSSLLRADGKEYKALAAEGMTLDKEFTMPESGHKDFTIFFEPLPDDVESFDFVMPKAFTIPNIHDRMQAAEGLTDTYWRNKATGDWLIGFAGKTMIYDSQLWDVVACKEKKGAYDYTVSNGDRELRIRVGKEKKGVRSIRVGEEKTICCDRITSRYMPHYPVVDTRTDFADNNYRMGDSVTIKGWYKDMDKAAKKKGNEFAVHASSLFRYGQDKYSAPMDSLGRFTLRVPVENVSDLYVDWGRTSLNLLVEPGETYFLMNDFSTGQTLVMGRDARVQNEIFANRARGYIPNSAAWIPLIGAVDYLAKSDSAFNGEFARVDSISAVTHLSERFRKYHRNSNLIQQGYEMMQGRFHANELPDEYVDYVTEKVFGRLDMPYSVAALQFYFMMGDYTSTLGEKLGFDNIGLSSVIKEAERAGMMTVSEADKQVVRRYEERLDTLRAQMKSIGDRRKSDKIVDAFSADPNTVQYIAIWSKEAMNAAIQKFMYQNKYNAFLHVMDSLGWPQQLQDIYLAKELCSLIDHQRTPLSPQLMEYAGQRIKMPMALDKVRTLQKHYEDLARKTLNTASLYSSDNVKGLTEGEQILRKILEPMRGKIVLLDIWGTWCSPCKEALSHSQEEYERLKNYDIVYLYLANNSSDASWKNTIKEYNVQGENVVHYNLPPDQQNAVENFLKVNSFPTYRLIDAEGHLLDVNADPRDLNALERVLKKLTGQE